MSFSDVVSSFHCKLSIFSIFFSKSTVLILTNFVKMYLWMKGIRFCSNKGPQPLLQGMKGIQFCSSKGPQPLPRGNNTKIVTKHIHLHRTTKPIWTKCGSKHSWVNGIQVNLNEVPFLFPLEGGTVITCRILVVIFEFYFFLSQSPGISIALLKLMSNVALWPLVKAVGQLYNILWWFYF